jgi:cytochrome o ubiquinol oxidase subunit 1
MLWTLAFMTTFVVGGMTGVMMAVPAIDFQVHNTLFLVAHFHNAIIGGVVFGYLAGFTYWFPKAFGFRLNERLGQIAFWLWIVGFYLAFMPLYALGLMGVTRRITHYASSTGWHPYFVAAAVGAILIACGFLFQVWQLIYSFKTREKLKDLTGDPWNGRTLEWSIPSPAPFYNFAVTPEVAGRDAFWLAKQEEKKMRKPHYEDIHMPKNTAIGLIIGGLGAVFGFAVTWHMLGLVLASLVGIFMAVIIRSLDQNTDYYLKADEVEKWEARYQGTKQASSRSEDQYYALPQAS